ncbi:MAG: outer membrane beta-barrel protein [Bacteroidetes bacterium]|nr:outer membrane beta-barrel protein [Bacteroidota bacterium]
MKKTTFLFLILTIFCFSVNAQGKWGLKAGADFATIKVSGFGSSSETGFFLGAYTTFNLSDSFVLQPELLYVNIDGSDFLSIPVLAKIPFGDKFYGLAGPSLNYFFDDMDEDFKINLDAGLQYDLSQSVDLSARYSFGLGDIDVNGFFVGIGFKF